MTLQRLRELDAGDALRAFRDEFCLPPGVIYLDGNSLGALPTVTAQRVQTLIAQEWGHGLVRSWNEHRWSDAPTRIGGKIARLIGAQPHEVVVTDSVSVNLFKLIVAALRARPGRHVVISERGNFPTDLYVLQGALDVLGAHYRLELPERDRIADAIDENTALVLLTHVHYKTAELFDMREVTARAHRQGALVLWDLSHSAGALPLDLNAADVDLAVGCGYKYLNGGPGAAAFLFVADKHQRVLQSPLRGWWGHARPFDFVDEYLPAPGIARFLCGSPPMLSLAALEAGVDMFMKVDMAALVGKAAQLSEIFVELVAAQCAGYGLELLSPTRPQARGSHVAFRHEHGYEIVQALAGLGVIGDFRAPDVLRFGFAPLYLRYEDIGRAVSALREVLTERLWDRAEYRIRGSTT